MKKAVLLIVSLLLMSCASSSSSNYLSSSSSSFSFASSISTNPYSFVNSDVSISSYDQLDKEYQVNGQTLIFNNCMKANKKWNALQMQSGGGEIYNKNPMNYNHVVLTLRNDSTSQYTSGENLNLYYGDVAKPLENSLTSDRVSSEENSIPIFTLIFSLENTCSYWRLFNDSPNAAYFLSATFSLE